MRRLLFPRAITAAAPVALLLILPASGCLTWSPGSDPHPAPAYDPAALERLTLEAANDARVANGLPPLRPDAALTEAARTHSADLARTGRISHTGSDGSSAATRAERAGVRYRALGENLYRSTLYASGYLRRDADGAVTAHYDWIAPADLARDAVAAWLASPGHRANLLNGAFGRAGTGVALDAERGWVVTMDYAD